MSVWIKEKTNPAKVVVALGDHRAFAFYLTGNAVAQFFSMESGILSFSHNDEMVIDKELFCSLVERLFSEPVSVFYGWAVIAAGLYEALSGEMRYWVWHEEQLPFPTFSPERFS